MKPHNLLAIAALALPAIVINGLSSGDLRAQGAPAPQNIVASPLQPYGVNRRQPAMNRAWIDALGMPRSLVRCISESANPTSQVDSPRLFVYALP